nr:hypothetical protein KPHV_29930 [Kitasatospora purpeofusca]
MTNRPETIGDFAIYAPTGDTTGWTLAKGGAWLPGAYDTRDAALLAVGIVLGGESTILLDDLRDQVYRSGAQTITVEDIAKIATSQG